MEGRDNNMERQDSSRIIGKGLDVRGHGKKAPRYPGRGCWAFGDRARRGVQPRDLSVRGLHNHLG